MCIDEINAAYDMGDPFLPPVGSLVQDENGQRWIITMSDVGNVLPLVGIKEGVELDEDGWPLDATDERVLGRHVLKVLKIPPDAPPFDEWARYGRF